MLTEKLSAMTNVTHSHSKELQMKTISAIAAALFAAVALNAAAQAPAAPAAKAEAAKPAGAHRILSENAF